MTALQSIGEDCLLLSTFRVDESAFCGVISIDMHFNGFLFSFDGIANRDSMCNRCPESGPQLLSSSSLT